MSDWPLAVGSGLALGVVTGMPLGVINLAIVDAAARGRARFARGLAFGGGVADAVHAALALLGVSQLVVARPGVVMVLAIIATLAIVAYAALVWRAPRAHADVAARPDRIAAGALTGIGLTLPNPAALGAWIAVAGALWPAATMAEVAAFALGVGVGSAAWFTLLGRLVARIPRDHKWFARLPRLAVAVLVLVALGGLVTTLVRA